MEKLKFKPTVTNILISINIIFYILMTLSGGSNNSRVLLLFGAKFNPLIEQGQVWRLVMPIFLHIGLEHLVLNCVSIYFLGKQLEWLLGKKRFLAIYILSGIGGNLASYYFNPNSISAGASTSIFGLFGIYIMMGLEFKNLPEIKIYARQIALLVLLNIGFSFFDGGGINVDTFGHIGGLLAGILFGYVLGIPRLGKIKAFRRYLAIVLVIVLLILSVKKVFTI
ncbi:rhomboid family intramembrane serine protease [Ligilactobacillus hayakitensis]|nr:rhomboid family intramembrane serine protease [Ligilactobacillus hayakitensis]